MAKFFPPPLTESRLQSSSRQRSNLSNSNRVVSKIEIIPSTKTMLAERLDLSRNFGGGRNETWILAVRRHLR